MISTVLTLFFFINGFHCFQPSLELPPLLEFINGTQITKPSQWSSRRTELKQLLDQYILGTKPSTIPNIKTWNKINTTKYNYATSSYYSFTLDLSGSTPIIFELLCPTIPNTNNIKYPIIMTQYNHREWSIYAVQRRFCSIRTPTADTRDDTNQFIGIYPNATWGKIPRRAWLDSRIIDFTINILSKQPDGSILDTNNIGIFGHSRNGKQSLIAAAYDERIKAVVGSSSGTPISAPFRLTARDFYGETCKSDKGRNWWTPAYQTFFGKENHCPSDGNFVVALIAPRYVMLANAAMDNEGDINFADDKNYLINKGVFYDLLNATAGSLTIQHRPGSHHGYVSIQLYLDFFSFAFGKYEDISMRIINEFINPNVFTGFTFDNWNNTYAKYINYTVPNNNEPLQNKISWLLGDDVLGIGGGYSPGAAYCEESEANNNYIIELLGQWKDNHRAVKYIVHNQSVGFGGYINGDIFYPQTNDKSVSFPVIIYLAGYNYDLGVVQTYSLHEESNTDPFYYHFATKGYIVVTYHQVGFGERVYDGKYFYDRYGSLQQTKFGHMVRDVRLIIDLLQCLSLNVRQNMASNPQCQTGEVYPNELSNIPNVDISSITVVGYAIGGAVGIHAAALDNRINNVASISGFTPFKNNTNNLSNSGNHYLYEYHSLIPKLGLFKGNEVLIPYDYSDLFDVIAPRNVFIYAPTMDRNANNYAVEQCLQDIKQYWTNKNALKNLTVVTPNDVSNWCNTQYDAIDQWLQNTT
eukprot:122617_1